MAATQKNRFIAIETALGADVLLLKSFALNEQLGRLYHIEAELLSEDFDIDFNALVGTNVTLRLATPSGQKRFFNGCVSRFVLTGNEGNFATYRATIVPWLWLLTRTADCRIFQNKKVPEIIEEVFKGHGFKDYKLKLSSTYRKWEYCVQYRETDFNFVSRLMEQEGIYYYFEHDDGIHTLVLVDAPAAHDAFPGYDTLTYRPRTQAHDEHRETVTDWVIEREVQTGLWTLADFNFKTPAAPIRANANVNRSHEHAGFEIYDYPGEYTNRPEGDAYAKLRIQEIQSQHESLRGQSTVRGLASGYKFTLKSHFRADQNRAYLVTGTSLQASTGAYESAGPDAGDFFTCGFTATPAAEPFRTSRSTPKPIIQGPQTAIVVGRAGEEIDPDEFGRVKVQFHWDRQGKKDENSSCWVRVSQQWAGKNWGAIHTPRIGQEVIVEFLEGDPDRPIITGRVYNAEQPPPYGMPANKTQSGIKSNSSPGGGGSNELRFEDKKGGEEVYLHGEKDLRIHVKNNETETVGASISTNAGGSISRSAGANISRTADVTITDKAGKDIITNSGKNMDLQAGGSYQLHTNLGIHLKAMNFVASLIESGAKDAAAAVKKGGAQTAAEAAAGGGAGGAAEGAQNTGMSAVAALSPAIEAGAAEISALSAQTSKNISGVETAGGKAGEAAATFNNAVAAGASPAVIAGAFMAMASAAAEAWDSAKKVVEGMLPQIPNIELWAMKDVNAHALWSMTLSTKVRNISIEAQNKDINVQAKQNINLEAKTKDINIKASKKKVLITAKEEVNVTAEDKNLVIEAKKKKVFVKSADQIFLKCGSASISMSKNGNIVLKGAKININGSGPVTVKGTPIKLN